MNKLLMATLLETEYLRALSCGRPKHGRCDDFSLKHPKMLLSQRAKIFSPFAALTGFEEAIDEKVRPYVEKRELNDEEQAALETALSRLHDLTKNLRMAKENLVAATVTFFVPCADEDHEAYGRGGSYERYTGTVWKVDPILTKSLLIGDRTIEFSELAEIVIQEDP